MRLKLNALTWPSEESSLPPQLTIWMLLPSSHPSWYVTNIGCSRADITSLQLRKLTFASSSSNAANVPIMEIDYERMIEGLDLDHDQFVDLCILCGCDYTDTIKGVGPKIALRLLRQHTNIEGVIKFIKSKEKNSKYTIPESWEIGEGEEERVPDYVEARNLFLNHEVDKSIDRQTVSRLVLAEDFPPYFC